MGVEMTEAEREIWAFHNPMAFHVELLGCPAISAKEKMTRAGIYAQVLKTEFGSLAAVCDARMVIDELEQGESVTTEQLVLAGQWIAIAARARAAGLDGLNVGREAHFETMLFSTF